MSLQQAMKASDIAQMRTIPADQIMDIAAAGKIVFSGPTIEGVCRARTSSGDFVAGQADRRAACCCRSVGNDINSQECRHRRDQSGRVSQRRARSLYGADAGAFLQAVPCVRTMRKPRNRRRKVARISLARQHGARLGQGADRQSQSRPIWLVQYNHPHPYPPGVVITDMDVKSGGRLSQFRSCPSGTVPWIR